LCKNLTDKVLKAAAWFDEQGYPAQAVDHALRSGDPAQAKELILKHWFPLLSRGEVTTVLRWLDALPEAVQAGDPSMALASCWAFYLSGQIAAIAPHLERANDAYERMVSEGTLTGTEQSSVAAQTPMDRTIPKDVIDDEHTRAVRDSHRGPSERKLDRTL
jgi:ATP/maltotriose-dependent transcriptional regulator MalT